MGFAGCVRSSCGHVPSGVGEFFTEIGTGILSFFVDENNIVVHYFRRVEGRDKALKMADPIFDALIEIAKANNASEKTVEGLGKGRALAKAGRDAVGFFNVFAGIIPALIASLQKMWVLTKQLFGYGGDPNIGKFETFLELGSTAGKAVGAATYAWGFGFVRVVANIEKYCGVEFTGIVHELGRTFPKVMAVNHAGSWIGSAFGLGHAYVRHQRVSKSGGNTKEAYNNFKKKVVTESVALFEKSLELTQDFFILTGKVLPKEIRITLGLGIGLAGVTKETLKSYYDLREIAEQKELVAHQRREIARLRAELAAATAA